MSVWRVVGTDTERNTGVAQVCDKPGQHNVFEDAQSGDEFSTTGPIVYDCCPRPHIECWAEEVAVQVAQLLTEAEAEPCS